MVQKPCANKAAATNGHTGLQLTSPHLHHHMASALWDPGLRADVESLTHLCAAIGESGNICIFLHTFVLKSAVDYAIQYNCMQQRMYIS